MTNMRGSVAVRENMRGSVATKAKGWETIIEVFSGEDGWLDRYPVKGGYIYRSGGLGNVCMVFVPEAKR